MAPSNSIVSLLGVSLILKVAGKPKDRRGHRYGRLTVETLSERRNPRSGGVYWWCRCDCGNIREVAAESLSHSSRKKKIVTECLECARRLQAPSEEYLAAAEKSRRKKARENRQELTGSIPEEWLALPLTAGEARELGLTRFFNGNPCPNGHIYYREAANNRCVLCSREKAEAYRNTPQGREKTREYSRLRWADPKRRATLQEKRAAWASSDTGKDKLREAYRRFYCANRLRVVRSKSARARVRYREDPVFRLVKNLRRRVGLALVSQSTTKDETTLKLVGCTLEHLVRHLESRFKDGQCWENYGEWHVDHIRPCASFDLSDPMQRKECFHWSNLQPLWGDENLTKRDRWDP